MSRRELLIILVCIVLLAIPLYVKVFLKSSFSFKHNPRASITDTGTLTEEQPLEEPLTEESEAGELGSKSTGIYQSLGTFVVNIAHTEAQRFLRVSVTVELDNKKVASEVKSKTSIFKDSVISIISSKDFREIEEIDGKDKLRKEIMDAVNKKLEKGKVVNVYFEDFVAQ